MMVDKMCMVEDCQEEAVKAVFDGNFWVLACQEHAIEFREFAKTNNLKFEEKEVPWKKNRIAVHVLDDFCLPLQKGMPGEKEREDSNREIDKVLKEHNCDWSDYSDEGYFVPDDWIDRGNKITFRNTEGQWENVKRDWVIFEKEHPDFFEHLDKQQGGGNSS